MTAVPGGADGEEHTMGNTITMIERHSRATRATGVTGAGRVRLATASAIALALGATTLLAGCGGEQSAQAVKAAASSSASGAADGSDLSTAKPPPDPLAKDVPTVKRSDAAKRRLPAATQAFDKPVSFSDGVALRVGAISQSTSDAQGPGEFHGRPQTSIPLTLTNGSKQAVDLSAVVVTMTYGTPARVAAPVYGDGAIDFSGTVKPGAKATATYLFAVPAKQLGDVTMSVDFDGQHAAATFEGSVR